MTVNTSDVMMHGGASTTNIVSQVTAVEQSRAVAEVQAAIIVAQRCPRNVQQALRDMRDVCKLLPLADRAFFSFRRGGSNVEGPTIHLARELARIWGNIQYGFDEMDRNNDGGYSELAAWAWDVQTNTRPSQKFRVPHRRDTKGGARDLTDLRDIYENNANMGSRRLRAQIFSVLPSWFTDEAIALCRETLKNGGGVPLEHRISEAVQWFSSKLGVSRKQMEDRIGRPASAWTEDDVANLRVVGGSISRGEARKEDEFPEPVVSGADVTGVPVEAPAVDDPTLAAWNAGR